MDILSIIQLVLLGMIGVIFLLPVLWGLVRGWKKGLFRLIWMLAIAVVLLFVSYHITDWALHFDLSIFHFSLNGHTTVMSYVNTQLQSIEQVQELMSYGDAFESLIVMLPSLIGSVIFATLLYWLLKWLTWPIWAILSKVFIKKYTYKTVDGKRVKTKKKKGKLLGAVTGLGLGYLTCCMTMIPIVGISRFANDIDQKYVMDNGNGVITDMIGKDNQRYLGVYENSMARQILTYTGIDGLSNILFKQLTTTTKDGYNISLTDEADQLVGLYADMRLLEGYDFSDLTQEQLDNIITVAKRMINNVFDSNLLKFSIDEIVPPLLQSIADDSSTILTKPNLGNNLFNQALSDTLHAIVETNSTTLKNDIFTLLSVIETMNNERMLLPIIKMDETADYKDYFAVIGKASSEFGTKISESLLSFTHSASVMPIIFNTLVAYGCETLSADFEKSNVDITKVKQALAGIIDSFVMIANDTSKDTEYYVAKTSLYQVADTVDMLMGSTIITDTTKDNILVAVKDKILTNYKESIPSDLVFVVEDFANAVIAKNSLAGELKIFADAYYAISEDLDGKYTAEALKAVELKDLGRWLDILCKSDIYHTSVLSLFDHGTDYVLSLMNDDMREDFEDAFTGITTNLTMVESVAPTYANQTIGLWQYEMDKLQVFYNNVLGIVEDMQDNDNHLELNSETFNTIGLAFDSALQNGSLLIKSNNIGDLFGALLDQVALPEDISSIMIGDKTIVEQLKANAYAIDGVNYGWADELTILDYLLNQDFTYYDDTTGQFTLTHIGATLDTMKQGKLFDQIVDSVMIEMIDNLKTEFDGTDSFDVTMTSVLEGAKDNVDDVVSYEEDLTAIETILNTGLSDLTLKTAGSLLDDLASTTLLGNQVPKLTNHYVEQYATSLDEKYEDIVSSIKTNLATLVAGEYETEMGYIADAVDLLQKDTLTQNDIDTFVDSITDALGNSKSKVLTDEVIKMIIDLTFDEVVASLLADYNNAELIEGIKANIEDMDNIGQLLDDIDTLTIVASDLDNALSDLDTLSSKTDVINDAIDSLYNTSLVGSDNTKLMTEITLNSIETLTNNSDKTAEEKQAILDEIASAKTDLEGIDATNNNANVEYKNIITNLLSSL